MEPNKLEYLVKIESFDRKYLKQLTLLFQNTRKKKNGVLFFQKKYSTNWCKSDLLGKVLLDEDNILIGFCGTTLYQFKGFNNERYLFGQLGDLLMHPENQGKGYFKQLLNDLEHETQKRGIDALFVFPNINAQPLFNSRKHWEQIGTFLDFGITVKTYPLLKALNKLGLNHLFYHWVRLFGSTRNSKTSWANVNWGSIHIQSDTSYFEYKKYGLFRFHKFANGKEIIWSLSDGLIINGSQVETIEELQNEILFLKTYCKWRGIHQFRYICYDQSKLGELLKKTNLIEGNRLPVYFKSFNPSLDPSKIVFQGIDRNAF